MVTDYNAEEPWARQPCDTDLGWAIFQDFLTMPAPRRLADLVKRPGFPLHWAQLQTIAWEDGWVLRSQAWDEHLDRLRIQTIEKVTQENAATRARRQGALSKKLQALGELELDKLIAQSQRDKAGFGGLIQPRDIVRFITLGIRTERLALGDVTDRVESGPSLANLSVEDLRALRELQEKTGEDSP